MAHRWERLNAQLNTFRQGLETPGPAPNKDYLVEDVASALAACDVLMTQGPEFDRPAVPPRFAVAYKDVADWFGTTRLEVNASLASAPLEEVLQRAETIRQQGVEVLYELDQTSVAVPELDGYETDYDTRAAARLLETQAVARFASGDPARGSASTAPKDLSGSSAIDTRAPKHQARNKGAAAGGQAM
jgi:hypothetical protein